MNSKWTEKEITRLAEKHGLRKTTIRMIVMSQFEGVKEVMNLVNSENDYYPSVRLKLFGLFMVNKKKLKYLSKKLYLEVQRRRNLFRSNALG